MHSTQEVGRKEKLARYFKKWESYVSVLKRKTKTKGIFSLALNILCWLLMSPYFEFFGDGKYDLFWARKLIKIWYWFLKSSCFELLGDGKYGLFFRQKVNVKVIFTWCFWVFHDIPGSGKYGSSYSDTASTKPLNLEV